MVTMEPQLSEEQSILARVETIRNELRPSERRVADYILNNSSTVVHMSVLELSEAAGASQSTVVRCCRSLGLSGFQELKIHLARDTARIRDYAMIDIEHGDDDAIDDLDYSLRVSLTSLEAARSSLRTEEFKRAVELFAQSKTLLVLAHGTSLLIAQYAVEQFTSIGLNTFAPQNSDMINYYVETAREDTAVLIISHSGANKQLLQAAQTLRDSNVPVIALTSFYRSPLAEMCDAILCATPKKYAFRMGEVSARLVQLAVVNSLYLALARVDPERSRRALDIFYRSASSWRI